MDLVAERPLDDFDEMIDQASRTANGDLRYWEQAAKAAREAGRFDEARALLLAAVRLFPDASQIHHDLAHLSEHRGDWVQAEQHWRSYSDLNPTVWWAAFRISYSLRQQGRLADAEQNLRDASDRFPTEPAFFAEYAVLAELRHDWSQAGVRWADVALRFPSRVDGLYGQARALRQSGDIKAARQLFIRTAEQFPTATGPLAELAKLAEGSRDWTEAERWWRAFLSLQATHWWAHTGLANALRHQGRTPDAEACLEKALELFPAEPGVYRDYALLAEFKRDWHQAHDRWAEVTRRFPSDLEGAIGTARVLRELGREDDVKALLVQAAERFPTATAPLHDLARRAESRRDWAEAEQWWRAFVSRDPSVWWAHTGLAGALREQGRLHEAKALLAEQRALLPQDRHLWFEYARLADRSKAWAEAAEHWADAARQFPDDLEGYSGQARALQSAGRVAEAQAILFAAMPRFHMQARLWQELARLAEAAADWALAAQYWQASIKLDDSLWWSRTALANALSAQGQTAEAKIVLIETRARFPNELGVAISLVRLAEAAGDWECAYQQWKPLLDDFPNEWSVHHGLINAALRTRRFDEAEALFAQAQTTFPSVSWFFVEHARQAEAHRNWDRAEALWCTAEERFPLDVDIRAARVNALREAGDLEIAATLLAEAAGRFPESPALIRQQALLLGANENWGAAADVWLRYLDADPKNETNYVLCAHGLVQAGRATESYEVLKRACQTFGNRPTLLRELGAVAERASDFSRAVEAYRTYMAACPGAVDGIERLANALANDGKLADGEALLRDAVSANPESAPLAFAYARFAVRKGVPGSEEFLKRARSSMHRFPGESEGYLLYARALTIFQEWDEAETVLRTANERFKGQRDVARNLADTLWKRGKWDDSLALYVPLASEPPIDPNIVVEAIKALADANRFDQADVFVGRAIKLFPASGPLRVAELDISIAAGRVEQAVARWQSIQERFSWSNSLRSSLWDRRIRLLDMGVQVSDTRLNLNPKSSFAVPDETFRIEDIVGQFESLGGVGIGCEFGQFQRSYNAEPLGLLRWASITPQQLAEALEVRFEGVGTPDQTILENARYGDHQEYTAADRRFGMQMHTFVPMRSVPYDKMFVQMCRRLSFLSNKLQEDLKSGAKIFVYKNAVRNLTDQEIDRIYTAMRAYGETTLLYVRLADADTPFPTVVSPKPGLIIGHIDCFRQGKDGISRGLPRLSWDAIVSQAYRIWKK